MYIQIIHCILLGVPSITALYQLWFQSLFLQSRMYCYYLSILCQTPVGDLDIWLLT